MSTPGTTPAGWYDDGSGRQRWWDGTAWTDQYRAPAAPPAAGPVYIPTPIGQPGAPGYGYAVSPKSRAVASILGFFLGVLGIDRFYLGNIGLGVAKLLVGWLTLGIWPLIDWIIILAGGAHDGQGLPVRNWG